MAVLLLFVCAAEEAEMMVNGSWTSQATKGRAQG